ncbi:hypothetical protein MJO29_007231 [Puccinia striiformis f. sp. tritici]|nr:hypothetical protein MJO29_007231 [Puccinia striiformis f. sp. tritici]
MASTGEVASLRRDVHEAYWASLLSTNGFKLPKQNSIIPNRNSDMVQKLGFKVQCSSPEVEAGREVLDEDHVAHRNAVDFGLPLINNNKCARLFVEALAKKMPKGGLEPYTEGKIPSRSWSEFVGLAKGNRPV